MESIKIVRISILLAILYGICPDLITVNISIEYFTIGHPKIIESESLILLAIDNGWNPEEKGNAMYLSMKNEGELYKLPEGVKFRYLDENNIV